MDITSANSKVVAFTQLLKQYGFQQIIKAKTRTTNTSATTIVFILTNTEEKVAKSGVIACPLSDHDLICCIRKHKSITAKASNEQHRETQTIQ